MRKYVAILLFSILWLSSALSADDAYRYRFGINYGLGNLRAAQKPYYTFNHSWGIAAGINGRRSTLSFSLLFQQNYSDSTASGHFGFFSKKDRATLTFKSIRAGFDYDFYLLETGRYRPMIGAGLGYMIWKFTDPAGDTVVQTVGPKGSRTDFSAAEMYLSGSAGLEITASRRWVIGLKTSFDYLTGVGTSFSDSVDDSRGRLTMRAGLSLVYLFGGGNERRPSDENWPSNPAWSQKKETDRSGSGEGDSDGDGVIDRDDKCPGTPAGAVVDETGCSFDSDGDGVPDGLDDCPQTPRAAAGYVDIFGCPIDADFDGVPDYRDTCRFSPPGVAVNDLGCPLDTDGDGVYDGRDDCPHTPAGIEVDDRGCIDIAFLNDTMRINIDYPPGSFEIDMRTRDRLQPLIRKLKILTDVKVGIYGYTDNVGSAEANQSLSEKRANRMRDWMVSEGIAKSRLTVVGKGETNFVASNQTAEGRALNRRIELIFSQ